MGLHVGGRVSEKEERLHEAVKVLQAAHERVADVFNHAQTIKPCDPEEALARYTKIRESIEDLGRACEDWLTADMLLDAAPVEIPAGALVLVCTDDGRELLTRTTGAPFVDGDGDHMVAVEGVEGLCFTNCITLIDEVRVIVAQRVPSGELVAAGDLAEVGCGGCRKLAGLLALLQEGYRQLASGQWLARFPPPERPPGPPLYGPGSPDDRKDEPEDPDAN